MTNNTTNRQNHYNINTTHEYGENKGLKAKIIFGVVVVAAIGGLSYLAWDERSNGSQSNNTLEYNKTMLFDFGKHVLKKIHKVVINNFIPSLNNTNNSN